MLSLFSSSVEGYFKINLPWDRQHHGNRAVSISHNSWDWLLCLNMPILKKFKIFLLSYNFYFILLYFNFHYTSITCCNCNDLLQFSIYQQIKYQGITPFQPSAFLTSYKPAIKPWLFRIIVFPIKAELGSLKCCYYLQSNVGLIRLVNTNQTSPLEFAFIKFKSDWVQKLVLQSSAVP